MARLHSLNISNNKLTTIEEATFDGITVVLFSGHSTLCCYLNPNSSCIVNQRTVDSVEKQSNCQSILSHEILLRILYFFMGATTTLISIIFIIKRVFYQKEKGNKTNKYIRTIAVSDILNGLYILLVLLCDIINELLSYKTTYRQDLLISLQYLSDFPGLSMIATRVEHIMMTVEMYLAICHVFSDFDADIRVARLITWTASVSYFTIDIVILKHDVLEHSVIWQPYYQTDYSTVDIVSIAFITSYELATSLVNIHLCTLIYKSVKRNERRIAAKRIPKRYLVARRLKQLTIGRIFITLCSLSLIVLLRSHIGLTTLVKQVLIAFVVPLSTIVNFVLFYNYG